MYTIPHTFPQNFKSHVIENWSLYGKNSLRLDTFKQKIIMTIKTKVVLLKEIAKSRHLSIYINIYMIAIKTARNRFPAVLTNVLLNCILIIVL